MTTTNLVPGATITCPCCSKRIKVTKAGRISAHTYPGLGGNRGSAPGSNVEVDPAKARPQIEKLVERNRRNRRRPAYHGQGIETKARARVIAWLEENLQGVADEAADAIRETTYRVSDKIESASCEVYALQQGEDAELLEVRHLLAKATDILRARARRS